MQDQDDIEGKRNHHAEPKVIKLKISYYFRLSSFERQVTSLKNEREKLIQISGDLKA